MSTVRSRTVREHSANAPGLKLEVRQAEALFTLTMITLPMDVEGAVVLKLVGSQIRVLRDLLNTAVEEEQS